MTTTTTDQRTALVAALHDYLACCEDETRKARTARNREALSLYEAGVPVSQLAGILGISIRGTYKLLDSAEVER